MGGCCQSTRAVCRVPRVAWLPAQLSRSMVTRMRHGHFAVFVWCGLRVGRCHLVLVTQQTLVSACCLPGIAPGKVVFAVALLRFLCLPLGRGSAEVRMRGPRLFLRCLTDGKL